MSEAALRYKIAVLAQMQAVTDITRLLVSGGPAAVETFTACFLEVVFKGQIKASRLSVVSYLHMTHVTHVPNENHGFHL